MLTDTVGSGGDVASLADLIVRTTGGNPLFVREYVAALDRDDLLRFDRDVGAWTWSEDEIRERGFTQNVLELMTARLDRLEPETRALLQVAACVGASFDLATLAGLKGTDVSSIWRQLRPAVQDGLLVTTSELEVLISAVGTLEQSCRFFHDRIQEAAYASMAFRERTATHLALGRLMSHTEDAQHERLFERVFQLNRARTLIDEPAERLQVAQLNLDAGLRAAASAANDAAAEYFSVGIDFLPDDAWEKHYDLCMGLHGGHGKALFGLADHDRAAEAIDTCIERARTDLERAELHVIVVQQHTTLGRYPEALEATRAGLALVGLELPRDEVMGAMMASFGQLQETLGGATASAFLDRPQMTDPMAIAQTRLLTWSMAPAFYLDPLLYSVIGFEAMKLIAEHGNPREALAIYSQYGHLLSAMFGDPKGGYEFTVVSRELCDRYGNIADKAQACFLSGNWALCWVEPFRNARPILEEGIRAGLQSGQFPFARYNMAYLGLNAMLLGEPLEQILTETREHLEYCARQEDQMSVDCIQAVRLAVSNLAGNTDGIDAFECDGIDDASFTERLLANQSMIIVCYYAIFKCAALTMYGEYADALAAADKATELLATIPGNICGGRLLMHAGVALAPVAGANGKEEPGETHAERLDEFVEKLTGYAADCEANWGHALALVVAERSRLAGDRTSAIDAYERAIDLAHRHGWVADHALACELAGRFWAGEGREELSRGYLAQARYGYAHWGARRKTEMLEAEFPELVVRQPTGSSAAVTMTMTTGTADSVAGQLDLSSVIKASQAISTEIRMGRLLESLVAVMVENAGAQRAVLIVADGHEMVVQAAAEAAPPGEEPPIRTEVQLNLSLGSYADLPKSVVHYAARTSEAVVVGDALHEGRFTRDPYVMRARPLSVMCVSVNHQGALRAILYVEHRDIAGAFTADRVEVTGLLASQFAISFENARLYDDMEGQVAQRTEELAQKNVELEGTLDDLRVAQTKLLASNEFIRRTFGRYVSDSVVDHLLEAPEGLTLGGERRPVTVLASDLRGFTAMAERLEPEETIEVMNRYFEAMFEPIHEYSGTISAIQGDGLFVFFGIPVAIDDAPRQAVACAIAMMRALDELKQSGDPRVAGLEMGIGVHTGSAVVGNVGSHHRAVYGAMGFDVNLAARIEACTVGGQVLVSDATAAAMGDDLATTGTAQFSVKGAAEPLVLFEVEGIEGDLAIERKRVRPPMRELRTPLPVRFGIVTGGVVSEANRTGAIHRLSDLECELVSDTPLAALTDLKLHVSDRADGWVSGDAYAKVLSVEDKGYRLGFTSVPPALREALAAAGGGPA